MLSCDSVGKILTFKPGTKAQSIWINQLSGPLLLVRPSTGGKQMQIDNVKLVRECRKKFVNIFDINAMSLSVLLSDQKLCRE